MKNNYRRYGDTKIISPKVIKIPTKVEKTDPEQYRETVVRVSELIEDGGYDPISQILGYILSEDPTHITNYRNARNLMSGIDRDELLEDIIKFYIDGNSKKEDI